MKADLEKTITYGIKALQAEKFVEAQSLFQAALKEAEAGPDKLVVAFCLDQLGETHFQQGQYSQAELYYNQAYQIRRQLLTPGHEDIVGSLNNLSAAYFFQGKYQMARPLCEQLVAIYETVLGKEHPELATCLINLGLVAMAEGKYGLAEKYYAEAHAIRQTVFGPHHALTGNSLSHLGSVYLEQKRFAAASQSLSEALAILEKNLGLEHPDLEKVLSKLIESLEGEGKDAEAENLYPRLMSLKEISLGPAHPEVIASLGKAAALYMQRGKYEEASKLYHRLLAIKRHSYGEMHPQVAEQLTNLAFVEQAQKLSAQAEAMFLQALHIYEHNSRQSLGDIAAAHTQFLVALKNLASFYDSDKRFSRSEKEWRRLMEITQMQAHQYPDHLMQAYEHLANSLIEQNKIEEAEPILRKALAFQQEVASKGKDESILDLRKEGFILAKLAKVLTQAGQYNEAELDYSDALDKLIRALGPNHPDLVPTMEGYADLLIRTYREEEAENIMACARDLAAKT